MTDNRPSGSGSRARLGRDRYTSALRDRPRQHHSLSNKITTSPGARQRGVSEAPDRTRPEASRRRSVGCMRRSQQGNSGAVDQLMAADIVSHGPWSPPAAGHRQDRQQAVRLRAAIPGLRVTQRPVRSRQPVVSRWTGSGIHPEPPHPPTRPWPDCYRPSAGRVQSCLFASRRRRRSAQKFRRA